jgi:glutathione S-transferase
MMQSDPSALPVLYSFRRCPYAIRARLAIAAAGIKLELREVALRAKPAQLLKASPKATVPVLQLSDGTVIDESLDIMCWALKRNDPRHWLDDWRDDDIRQLINRNDCEFKNALDRYKYSDRYPQHTAAYYRQQADGFLSALERRLQRSEGLYKNHFSFADAAIAPFVRQFAAVDPEWFAIAPYPALRLWLQNFVNSDLFAAVMPQYSIWTPDSAIVFFGGNRLL